MPYFTCDLMDIFNLFHYVSFLLWLDIWLHLHNSMIHMVGIQWLPCQCLPLLYLLQVAMSLSRYLFGIYFLQNEDTSLPFVLLLMSNK